MPAAAVIPAPIAYIKVVAVEKLVVEFLSLKASSPLCDELCFYWQFSDLILVASRQLRFQRCYFEKIRVLQAGVSP